MDSPTSAGAGEALLPQSLLSVSLPHTLQILLVTAAAALLLGGSSVLLRLPAPILPLRNRDKSNLADEFLHLAAATAASGDGGMCTVKALYIYPIKSCRGIELSSTRVERTGFQWDRQFTFAELHVDATTAAEGEWRFLTQRKYPRLAGVRTALHLERGVISARWGSSWFGVGGGGEFSVPLQAGGDWETVRVTLWKDRPEAWRVPVPARTMEALRRWLGVGGELALYRVKEAREVYRCAPRREEIGWQPVTGFADAYPLHVVNLASVRDVNARVAKDIPELSVLRFRPNIILTGPAAFDEDDWKRFTIAGNPFYAACRTVRCKLPNVHPETGARHPVEPDATMRRYRNIDAGAKNSACLGLQVVPARESGVVVAVGDEVVVEERGEHYYIR